MIFIDNKYTRWYYNIVNNAKTRTTFGYTESHHIIPKSCGGDNSKANLVKLTAKEHFICHLLLTKAVDDNFRSKMIYAFHGMKAKQPKQIRYISNLEIGSKLYQKLKEELSTIKKSQTPWNKGKTGLPSSWNKGISPSDETKKKIREARSKQDMSYRKGHSPSIEQREKISQKLRGNTPWNKGKKGAGSFAINNPMKNPESIKKMLETRRLNKEKSTS
jgi:NUMOD3 motif